MHTPTDSSNKETSVIISLIRSSTPQQIMKSPSVVPKNLVTIVPLLTFDFVFMPTECRYYFKKKRQQCTLNSSRNYRLD